MTLIYDITSDRLLLVFFCVCFSEEVAFYNGNKKEQAIIMHTFKKLVDHLRGFINFRFYMGLIDNVIAKCK